MPENETLDVKTADRRLPIRDRLDRGESIIDILDDIEVALYRAVQRGLKQWKDRSVDPAALFDAAADGSEALPILLGKLKSDDFARLLGSVADEPCLDRDGLIHRWVYAVWDRVRDLIQLDRREATRQPDFIGRVGRMLDRLARRLAEDPSKAPPRPRRARPTDIDAKIGRSLL